MANFTPTEISDAIAAIIESVDGEGTCITDKRFTEDESELLRVLKSQTVDGHALGTILVWEAIEEQTVEDTCRVESIYLFTLDVFHPYANDSGAYSSDYLFKQRLFNLNEAINAQLDLGLNNLVQHQGLQSIVPFSLAKDWGEASEGEISHYTVFELRVGVTNRY